MADSPNEAEHADKTKATGGPVPLRERYLIEPASPLSELNSPSAKAYKVQDRQDPARDLFALVCVGGLPPRTKVMAALRGADIPGLLPLIEWDAVTWPPLGQRCMAMIYARPRGGRLITSPAPEDGQINEHELLRRVLDPLARAVLELARRNVTHGAIRLDNLFFMDEEKTAVVLGECVSAPPGYDQPVAFETIERALTAPQGRGTGCVGDDLFALGASVVALLHGQTPLETLGPDDVITARIVSGSYAAYCGKTRVPLALVEPLRAMLSDDPGERWDAEKLDLWLDGQRLTPIQLKSPPKAQTAFTIAGKQYKTARTLARALTLNVGEAAKAIKGGKLHIWVERSLKDAKTATAIAGLTKEAMAHQNDWLGSDDAVVAKTAILLDPQAPIRYRGFSFLPDGYGAALAAEFLRRGDIQVAVEAVVRELPGFWLSAHKGSAVDKAAIAKTFGQLRGFLQINEPGYGIERCLYELNPSLPCQSPLLAGEYVVDIRDLLPALDRRARRVDGKTRPMDRHIAAFIAARFNEDIESHLRTLGSPQEDVSLIGMLRLLALLQWQQRAGALYGLSRWVGGLLGPAVKVFRSRTTRSEVEHRIPGLVRQGNLADILDLIEGAKARKDDARGYTAACAEFADAAAEIRRLAANGATRTARAEQTGQRVAAMVSVAIAVAVVGTVLMSGMR